MRAVLCDLDGLLVDTEPLYRRAYQAAGAEQGLAITDAVYAAFVGRSNAECEVLLAARFGGAFDAPRFRASWPRHLAREIEGPGVPLKPGALELIELLERRAALRAVVSSSHRRDVERCLAAHGLVERFQRIVTGDEVERSKPAPDIYLRTAALLEVPPGECLALEDSNAGVAAAAAAGMMGIQVPDLEPSSAASMARVLALCASLYEALPHLERLLTD